MSTEIDIFDLYNQPSSSALGILLQLGQAEDDFNSIVGISTLFSDDAESIEYALVELVHLGLVEILPLEIADSKLKNVLITDVGHTFIAMHTKSLLKNYWGYF